MLVHQQPLLPAVAHPASAPLKRRRRAPTTGAAEDCFTCRANGEICDRRRPYCGPCLDIGNECKGYRTQLTWGVGVASRGKLRGMTLPVSIESNISVAERDRRCAIKKKPVDQTKMRHPSATSAIHSAMAKHAFPRTPKSPTLTESYATSMVNTPIIQSSYPPPLQHPPHRQEYPSATVLNYHKPSYSHEAMNSRPSGLIVSSSSSEYDQAYTGHSDSPYSLSPSLSDTSTYDVMVSSTFLPPSSLTTTSSMLSYAPLLTSTHPGSQFTDGHIITRLIYISKIAHPDPEAAVTLAPYSASISVVAPSNSGQYQHSYSVAAPHMSIVTQLPMELLSPQLAHLAPELRFLIDHYDKSVCPSIVAFDGPSNPYRSHILRLAFQNSALMEAVYALASSHLQQRKKIPLLETRRSSPPRFSSRSSSHVDCSTALSHKNASIKLLNSQLSNNSLAVADAAMATLLTLCLYHICETGVGQFKTHLAGVKKLMGMRCVGKVTGRWGWMETVFTWLDNMSASVNDREAQLRGDYLDMIAETNDDWDLESLTGCNRYLFMRLAKLAKVNMLSQQVPISFHRPGPYRHNHMGDDNSEPVRNEYDGRDEFWAAWNAMKNDLLAWKPCSKYAATPWRHRALDYGYLSADVDFSQDLQFPISSTSTLQPTDPASSMRKASKAYEAVENDHWLHSSNVWRYAAIIYLDRLAYPHLRSSHHVFQSTIRIVLDHLNCIPTTSGLSKSLMWPLFITGTECVVGEHRMFIRERCFDMQRDCGFFNKVSGLDILETIWDQELDEDSFYGPSGYAIPGCETIGGRGLKWRRAIQQEDGEYLMI
ncbi:hypothetical protein L211DRAFT_793859 [Terfezia boudieri ATCC MYA-4762]|uniref:Zn(2)-C6 fungal-type domain-containing protein n=1 Tax=Terfezia boudieri ATCC MYA-4762 TaxID=1051890 RepID=A0A3N4LDP9_9PEZI|nr:hypothetical protein L211DRAFT_793859 [Terfezia boudieri ATCC MYA-4762]